MEMPKMSQLNSVESVQDDKENIEQDAVDEF